MEYKVKFIYGIERKIYLWNLKRNLFMEFEETFSDMNYIWVTKSTFSYMNYIWVTKSTFSDMNYIWVTKRNTTRTIYLWNLEKNLFMEFEEKFIYGIKINIQLHELYLGNKINIQ